MMVYSKQFYHGESPTFMKRFHHSF